MNVEPATKDTALATGEWESDTSLASQLERAKEELELVSYVTSHDLQAPLRTMTRLCDELSKHPDMAQNKAPMDILQNITNEVGHMKTLMQGLLDYMRLETYGPSHSLLDANEIVTAAITVLEERIRVSNAKITYDVLPEIYGHRGRITRLFLYLLDNALKFRSDTMPVIHISAALKGKFIEFCVKDNGIGIDEEYNTIIFQLFSRLHTAEEYPGDGIGLALCRKIVESHGGKIRVESLLTEGCQFRFTLPSTPINP